MVVQCAINWIVKLTCSVPRPARSRDSNDPEKVSLVFADHAVGLSVSLNHLSYTLQLLVLLVGKQWPHSCSLTHSTSDINDELCQSELPQLTSATLGPSHWEAVAILLIPHTLNIGYKWWAVSVRTASANLCNSWSFSLGSSGHTPAPSHTQHQIQMMSCKSLAAQP